VFSNNPIYIVAATTNDMNKYATLCAFLFLFFQGKTQTIFIKPNAIGDGSSWQNAKGDLRAALASAKKGTQIWVAKGTYYTTYCAVCTDAERRLAFEIPDSIAVYGGFNGTETSLSQRNWKNNETILSGDIDRDNLPYRNTFNVIYTYKVGNQTIMDGFTISNGNANDLAGAGERYSSGGAMYNDGRQLGGFANPSVRNCIFKDNLASGYGGAIYNGGTYKGNCSPNFKSCYFTNNLSVQEGGAVFNNAEFGGISSPTFEFCQFVNNRSNAAGGAVFSDAVSGKSYAVFQNCQFIQNTADTYGGGIYNLGKAGDCSPVIIGCLFWKNKALSAAGVYCLGSENGNSSPQIVNSIFYKNEANTGGSIYANANDSTGKASPNIVNCIIWQNKATIGRVLRNIFGTPTIKNSIVDADFCEDIHSGTGKGVTCAGGLIFNQDPLFINAEEGNFHVKPASPTINAGADLSFLGQNILTDLDSTTRILSGKIDIGCYEFNPSVYFAPEVIRAPANKTICDKEPLILTVLVSGTPPLTYQWYKNNVLIPNATSDTLKFVTTNPSDSGTYKCIAKNSQNATATTADARIVVRNIVPFGVNLAQNNTINCENDIATFIASTQNGGAKPKYEWLLNNTPLGITDSISQITLPYQSMWHMYSCRITTSDLCATPKQLTTNALQYNNVLPRDTTKIGITGLTTEVCAGTNQTFTASAVNGGDIPQYLWLVNDIEKQKNGLNTFNINTLNNNDKVKCVLISSKKCVTNITLLSNEISAKIKAKIEVIVNLSANKNIICANEKASFWTVSYGGGFAPQYQWFINTTPVGTNSIIFESADLKNNDIVKVRMTSSETCVTQSTVESNTFTMRVNMCTGVDDINGDKISIYPNPSLSGHFTLDMQDVSGIKTLDIYNPFGQLIFSKKIENIDNQRLISIDLGENRGGAYLLRLSGEGFQIHKKLMKI
jgi:hypothetical protein